MLKNCNLKRPWVSCMSDSSLNFAWQLHHVPSCKRIRLSFAWNQYPLSTDKICSMPTGWWCQKTTHCCFCCAENCSLFLCWRLPTGKKFDAHWKNFWCPLADDVKNNSLLLLLWWKLFTASLLSTTHWQIFWCPLAVEDAHWLRKLPTGLFC